MRKTLSLLLCVCMLLTILSPAFAAFADAGDAFFEDGAEVDEAYGEDWAEVEDMYTDGGTVYDLENELDIPITQEEAVAQEEADEEDAEEDADIYGSVQFDAENAAQISGAS